MSKLGTLSVDELLMSGEVKRLQDGIVPVLGLRGPSAGIEGRETAGAVTQPGPAAAAQKRVSGEPRCSSLAARVCQRSSLTLPPICPPHLLWELRLLLKTVFPSHSVEVNNIVIPG